MNDHMEVFETTEKLIKRGYDRRKARAIAITEFRRKQGIKAQTSKPPPTPVRPAWVPLDPLPPRREPPPVIKKAEPTTRKQLLDLLEQEEKSSE